MQKMCGESFNSNLTGQAYNATSGLREPANLTGTITLSEANVGKTGVEPGTYACDSQEMFTVYGGGAYSDTMYQTEFDKMATSVAKNGGFYVGRYETGGFNETKVVSKPDRGMSGNGDTNNTTWYKMYQMQKDFGNEIVGSSMIWGCQYDQAMKFVNGKLDGTGQTFSVTEPNSNRHLGSSTIGTGNTPADFAANIYDLAGNMWEWTLEAQSFNGAGAFDRRVGRGGCYNFMDATAQRSTITSYSGSTRGSRLALYVK